MKIIDPICENLDFMTCSLKDYIMEIIILLIGIIMLIILVGVIGHGLHILFKGIKYALEKEDVE